MAVAASFCSFSPVALAAFPGLSFRIPCHRSSNSWHLAAIAILRFLAQPLLPFSCLPLGFSAHCSKFFPLSPLSVQWLEVVFSWRMFHFVCHCMLRFALHSMSSWVAPGRCGLCLNLCEHGPLFVQPLWFPLLRCRAMHWQYAFSNSMYRFVALSAEFVAAVSPC